MALIFPLGLLVVAGLSFLIAAGLRRLFAEGSQVLIAVVSAGLVGFLPSWGSLLEHDNLLENIVPSLTLTFSVCSLPAWMGSKRVVSTK